MKGERVIDASAIIAVVTGLYMAFIFAPQERVMGAVQKIFFFHVASAWIAFFAFFVTFVCGILFLARNNYFFDDLASSSAELGLIFCTIVLITGPIWARPAWGVWWTWDLRLTTTTILWFIYLGYIMLRKFTDDDDKRAKFSAAVGIIGFIDVPIVFFSIRWWRTIHPNVVQEGGGGLHPDMTKALLVAVLAFSLVYVSLLIKRVRVAGLERKILSLERN